MPYETTDEDRLRDATRLINRALRTQNRNMRRQIDKLRKEMDEKLASFFEAPSVEDHAE